MSRLGQKDEDVTVLTVSEEDDGTDPDTLRLLKHVCPMHVLAGKKVFLWSSTPCTGGSPFQHLNLHRYKEEYRKNHLNHLWTIHRKLWRAVVELSEYVHGWAIEWPLRSAYWSWRQTKHFMKTRRYEVSWVVVDACMAGVVVMTSWSTSVGRLRQVSVFSRMRYWNTHAMVSMNIRLIMC